jgi:hypothetical protein
MVVFISEPPTKLPQIIETPKQTPEETPQKKEIEDYSE